MLIRRSSLVGLVSIIVFFTINAHAELLQAPEIVGSKVFKVDYYSGGHGYVSLMKIKPSKSMEKLLDKGLKAPELQQVYSTPPSKMLDISNVPVLSQGKHETCVTFAAMGAIDNVIAGNDIASVGNRWASAMCTLQLLKTEGKDAWSKGSVWMYEVARPLIRNGYMDIGHQRRGDCNSYYREYPVIGNEGVGSYLDDLDHYKRLAKKGLVYKRNNIDSDTTDIISTAKKLINQGKPVLYAFALSSTETNASFDSDKGKVPVWAYDGKPMPDLGHQVYLYGYNDNQCVNYRGREQCGLLYIRNSWSKKSGLNGSYAMTYDYALHRTISSLDTITSRR